MAAESDEDPFLWLEEVTGDRAIGWVRDRNAVTEAELQGDPRYAALRDRFAEILNSDAKIPYVTKIGDHYYNFWQDATHVQGVWRRTTLEAYRAPDTAWETVLDLDALSAAEGKRWVWHGASCLPPAYQRCLVGLSAGGSDADTTREFDLTTRAFVPEGFVRPEAKGELSWLDADTVFLTSDFGPETTTTSGYPRQVRVWKRGTPIAAAEVIFEGQADDVSVSAGKDFTAGFEREWVTRGITFYSSETYLRRDGKLVKLDVPADANTSSWREWLLVELRSPWTVGTQTFPAGALVAADLEGFLRGERAFQALFTPTETRSLASFTATRETLALNLLDQVRSEVVVLRPGATGWTSSPMTGLPSFGAIGVSAVDPDASDDLWLTVTDFLTPTSLALVTPGKAPETLKSMPTFFDAAGLEISQQFATSADGTQIPYFLVHKAGLKRNGKTPTLLYGYGGFEVSMTPSYSGTTGTAWLAAGGAYALANIRGGGEFGPRWHQAALKEHRHRAYEDFAAVADHLVETGVTKPKHLGAMGGSNGGLLMGNMLTQYPDRFGAIVCQVPLLDMKRYSQLLAGASWMGEYGDPSDPAQWSFIQTFSPYHLARADARYPRVLFTTSTKDDRVHPGHARKMAARLMDQGHDVLYWENLEGGHGGAANNDQRAQMLALAWTFLWRELE
jgi:prolyl oligopeptidase